MRSVKELKDINGKKVLVRVDFNLPIENGVILDDFRIKKALPTIKLLTDLGAKVILIAHLGKGGESLAPVAAVLNKFIPSSFVPEVVGVTVDEAIAKMQPGEVILLENLRNEKGEKECNEEFAKKLAKYGEIYVNESFPVDHREDASIVLLPKLLPAYVGLQLQNEIDNLSVAFKNPEHPFLFILGGAKFSTKMPLINKYLELADQVFIGGALANNFLKEKGYEIGASLVDDETNEIKKILENKKLMIPVDVVTQSGNKLVSKSLEEIKSEDIIVDIGEMTIKNLASRIQNAKLILWNGPLGKYEEGGEKGTKAILELVAESKAKSIIGGGDTVALISQMGMEDKFSFVSTGGGATLDFLANGTLPGIKALE
ncbi:MAG: phosphoglycerate kinase [Patescibacteria group bacterium]